MNNFNFNTKTGTPITLDGDTEPSFYIDANDMTFMETAITLHKSYDKFTKDMQTELDAIDKTVDDIGIPVHSLEIVEVLKKSFSNVLGQIDLLLGEGVSEKVFKGRVNFNLLDDFMVFFTDVVEDTRKSSLSEHKGNREQRRATKNNKKVME